MTEITLLLHNIRSTHNVGSIFRTAEGFGVREIILTGYTPYPRQRNDSRLPHIADKITAQIHKTALGAEELVPFRFYEEVEDFLAINTLPLIALEQTENSKSLDAHQKRGDFILVLGEEVNGINKSLLSECEAALEIPMRGEKESFNVSVAAGIALYTLTRP